MCIVAIVARALPLDVGMSVFQSIDADSSLSIGMGELNVMLHVCSCSILCPYQSPEILSTQTETLCTVINISHCYALSHTAGKTSPLHPPGLLPL